jgi:hypothetical protein
MREAYLAGWSDCAARVMQTTPPPDDATVEVFVLGRIASFDRRLSALEGQYRSLKGDADDNASAIGELRSQLTPIDAADGQKSGGQ